MATKKQEEEAFIPFKQEMDIPPLPKILLKQDMNRLRNAIHNEAGVTKQEIREMVEQAVERLVDKRVKQLLPDQISMDRLVDQAVRSRSMFWGSDKDLDTDVKNKMATILAKKIKMEIK